jgi:phenylpropionate dioxygenase-like ring-hydroxylating dioxygenase large terminal subunit
MTLQLSMKPTGWFQIGWSGEIPSGAVRPMRYFGQDLVAFRTAAGELKVLDAYCRHLGAHLGHGGVVADGCVVCPYHGWEWDGDGNNTRVPYQELPTREWQVAHRGAVRVDVHVARSGGRAAA